MVKNRQNGLYQACLLLVYDISFFSKAEKSNSLALTDCVNAFVFFRLAGILKLREKAGESSIKRFFVVFSL